MRSPSTRQWERQSGLEFLTGYLIEYALSVDNIFVFVLIFTYFQVPEKYQHRVLFWGIIGALVLRGVMIVAGSALVTQVRVDALHIRRVPRVHRHQRWRSRKTRTHTTPSAIRCCGWRGASFQSRMTTTATNSSFASRRRMEGRGSPRLQLFIVLLIVDTTDIIFATDSIPAIFAVTRDPFIVYTSNICAVLGLARALFPARGRRRQVRLPQARTVAGADFHRREDAPRAFRAPPDRRVSGSCGRCSRRVDPRIAPLAPGRALNPICGLRLGRDRRLFPDPHLLINSRNFSMRFASRLAGAAALVLAPMSYASAQNAGKTLAMDFRNTVIIQGAPDTGVITGHAVGTADKMRLDVIMKGTSAQVSPLASDSTVSMIVTDTGKTIAYLDPKKSQYLRVRPAEMIAQAQQMGGMKMDFTDTKAQVDSLGAGPVILGHPTSHYRITTGMTMTISAMGQQQIVEDLQHKRLVLRDGHQGQRSIPLPA